ncbi:winged helix-turn-helix domain-containing protein [Dactylosporangium sp. NPDC050688]|uniref:winged helix-turn-helix domain-containing protein n=1 Tax=Dactylosporangium sp. NPDC050688 TaxID=3157217 RepID=UPI0034018F51
MDAMDGLRLGSVRYLAVADEIRTAILSGVYPPGTALPAEQRLCFEYRCGRDTVRDALDVVRGEGLIIKERGRPTRVTLHTDHVTVRLQPGTVVGARMPMRPETAVLQCRPEVPLLTVLGSDSAERLYPADRVLLVVPPAASA